MRLFLRLEIVCMI